MKRTTASRITKGDINLIKHLYLDEYYSMGGIALKTGIGLDTVHYYLKKLGLSRTLSQSRRLGIELGRIAHPCMEKSWNWENGKSRNEHGYILIKLPANSPFFCMTNYGYIREHRLIMAEYLKRPLDKNELVHHINGNRKDNRLRNLALVTRNNHPSKTFMAILQKRIRELEAELSQQKLC